MSALFLYMGLGIKWGEVATIYRSRADDLTSPVVIGFSNTWKRRRQALTTYGAIIFSDGLIKIMMVCPKCKIFEANIDASELKKTGWMAAEIEKIIDKGAKIQ